VKTSAKYLLALYGKSGLVKEASFDPETAISAMNLKLCGPTCLS